MKKQSDPGRVRLVGESAGPASAKEAHIQQRNPATPCRVLDPRAETSNRQLPLARFKIDQCGFDLRLRAVLD